MARLCVYLMIFVVIKCGPNSRYGITNVVLILCETFQACLFKANSILFSIKPSHNIYQGLKHVMSTT